MRTRMRAVRDARTSMPSPQSEPRMRLRAISATVRPRTVSSWIAAQAFASPSGIGTPTPPTSDGATNGGIWKPAAQLCVVVAHDVAADGRARSMLRP